jgi:hypothetical protein
METDESREWWSKINLNEIYICFNVYRFDCLDFWTKN